jgi:hypothetical protein
MNEQQIEPSDASEMSLATVGSQAPLVIDLPDGQKLVVGVLEPGTVIEIATWRGTGRPDSRTNRLMLGVSAPEEEIPVFDSTHSKKSIRSGRSTANLREVTMEDGTTEQRVSNNSASDSATSASRDKNEMKKLQKLRTLPNFQLLIKPGISILAIVLISAALVGPARLRVSHPHSGAASSLGSAKNSLVIIREGIRGKVGEPVIALTSDPKDSPVLALVTAVDGDNFMIATNSLRLQTNSKEILGKVQFVIPYLGVLANLIGK